MQEKGFYIQNTLEMVLLQKYIGKKIAIEYVGNDFTIKMILIIVMTVA